MIIRFIRSPEIFIVACRFWCSYIKPSTCYWVFRKIKSFSYSVLIVAVERVHAKRVSNVYFSFEHPSECVEPLFESISLDLCLKLLLGVWIACANSEGSRNTAHLCSIAWTFAVRMYVNLPFLHEAAQLWHLYIDVLSPSNTWIKVILNSIFRYLQSWRRIVDEQNRLSANKTSSLTLYFSVLFNLKIQVQTITPNHHENLYDGKSVIRQCHVTTPIVDIRQHDDPQ